ncbi:hypothetical protein [Methylogaea oryzae]|nr:hypothetical protein [Methylogaea oryzae]
MAGGNAIAANTTSPFGEIASGIPSRNMETITKTNGLDIIESVLAKKSFLNLQCIKAATAKATANITIAPVGIEVIADT